MTRDDCINILLQMEGGRADVAGDPGGATNGGVTQDTLSALRASGKFADLPASVDDLTREQIITIYEDTDWAQIRGDELPPALACVLLNVAVNEGEPTAVRILQSAVGALPDGVLGDVTMRAVAAWRSAYMAGQTLEEEVCARAAVRYAELYDKEGKFELGWMRRLMRVYTLAVACR